MHLTENDPRVRQLRALYKAGGHSAILLTQPPTLSWLLGGRMQIGIAGSGAVCTAVVNDAEVVLVTTNIEARRLAEEEVGPVPRILACPWADGAAMAGAIAGAAGPNPLRETDCAAAVQALRTCLAPQQEAEAAEVAVLCSRAMEETIPLLRPGMTEFEISGALAGRAIAHGLIPNVLFTPTDGHIARYRHALSGEKKLEKLVMLSMGAQKNGLYASITRFVCFGAPDPATLDAQDKACRLAAALYTLTRPGAVYADLYETLAGQYAALGVPDELALHHQGGLGGFQTRENRLTPDLPGGVRAHELYAWNPSVTGFKSEDMLLVGEEGNRVLTLTPAFPHKTYTWQGQSWDMPQILVL